MYLKTDLIRRGNQRLSVCVPVCSAMSDSLQGWEKVSNVFWWVSIMNNWGNLGKGGLGIWGWGVENRKKKKTQCWTHVAWDPYEIPNRDILDWRSEKRAKWETQICGSALYKNSIKSHECGWSYRVRENTQEWEVPRPNPEKLSPTQGSQT